MEETKPVKPYKWTSVRLPLELWKTLKMLLCDKELSFTAWLVDHVKKDIKEAGLE